MRNHEEHRGFEEDRRNLAQDWRNIESDFERALGRFASEVGRDAIGDHEGTIYVSVSPTGRVTDEDSQARSQSNRTPKKQRGLLSKLASIWSIFSSKLKL